MGMLELPLGTGEHRCRVYTVFLIFPMLVEFHLRRALLWLQVGVADFTGSPLETRHCLMKNVATLCLFGGLMACGTPKSVPADQIQFSGFLSDYSLLEERSDFPARLAWVRPDLDGKRYNKVYLAGLELWLDDDSRRRVDEKDMRQLLAYFQRSVQHHLGDTWPIVTEPQEGAVSIRAAITVIKPANPYMNVVTGAIPQGRLVSTLVKLSSGTALFVGGMGIEAEYRDSMSGELLGMGVDRRVGDNTIRNVGSTWATSGTSSMTGSPT